MMNGCKNNAVLGFHARRSADFELCLFCGAHESEIAARGETMLTYDGSFLPTPKPATAEPPEWKESDGERRAAGLSVFLQMVRNARAKVEVGIPTSPDPIAEFNARRIAKREMNPAPGITEILGEALADRAARILDRACRIDLHHTISDLIRPWRGK